jgi:hypothetical protein
LYPPKKQFSHGGLRAMAERFPNPTDPAAAIATFCAHGLTLIDTPGRIIFFQKVSRFLRVLFGLAFPGREVLKKSIPMVMACERSARTL